MVRTSNFFHAFTLACALWFVMGTYQTPQPAPEPDPVPLEVSPEAVILPPTPIKEIRLERISAYNPVPRQTSPDPSTSSCGKTLSRQIAVSRDLFFDAQGRKHLCGRTVTVVTDRGEVFEGYTLNDTMAARFSNTADVMFNETDETEAWAFGITTGTLYIY